MKNQQVELDEEKDKLQSLQKKKKKNKKKAKRLMSPGKENNPSLSNVLF